MKEQNSSTTTRWSVLVESVVFCFSLSSVLPQIACNLQLARIALIASRVHTILLSNAAMQSRKKAKGKGYSSTAAGSVITFINLYVCNELNTPNACSKTQHSSSSQPLVLFFVTPLLPTNCTN